MIGMSGSQGFWIAPVAKWKKRSLQIASSSASSFVGASLYNSRAVPVFSYLAQFCPLHIEPMEEKAVITSILHFPFTALPLGALFNLHRWGGVKVASLKVTALASHIRAARLTFFEAWQDSNAILQESAGKEDADIPFAQIHLGKPWDTAYGSPPFSWYLRLAFSGDVGDADTMPLVKEAPSAV